MTRLGIVVDTTGCVGCTACAMACKIENNLPQGVWWNRVEYDGGESFESPAGTYPNVSKMTFTVSCQHCTNAACEAVCPTGATHKDPGTGVVLVDQNVCIGCESCMSACPYDVRRHLIEEPTWATDHAVGDVNAPAHMVNTVEKCTMCWHRLLKGFQPACIEHCAGRVRYFGDFDDPESEVSQLIASREYMRLKEEAGTEPNIYYLV